MEFIGRAEPAERIGREEPTNITIPGPPHKDEAIAKAMVEDNSLGAVKTEHAHLNEVKIPNEAKETIDRMEHNGEPGASP